MHVHDFIDHWARRVPQNIAAFDGRRSVTWKQLQAWSNRVGQWLAARLEPQERFGLLSTNSLEMIAIYYGASRAGVVPVPLNTRLAPPEWTFILQDAEAKLLIAEPGFCEAVDAVVGDWLEVRSAIGPARAGWSDFTQEVSDCAEQAPQRASSPDAPLWQMYTSGTTGRPKGAVVSQRAMIANLLQIQTSLDCLGNGAGLVTMPMFHAGAAIAVLLNGVAGLCTRVAVGFDAAEILRILEQEPIAVAGLVPAMIQMLLQHPRALPGSYPHLKMIVYGASPIASEVLRRAIDVFGCKFIQAYGMTELSGHATHLIHEDHFRALQGEERLLLSCGRPLPGTELRIVGADGREAAAGEIGEIIVRGDQLMSGYWKQPAATADTIRDGWLHTGDAGYLDAEGYLFICDRVKDMIVSGGENVYPREIEEVLFKLPGVADATVIGVPDEKWGERPLAIIVRSPDATLDEAVIIAHCRAQLAGYKCPKTVLFTDSLPRNATGKVLKRDLRAPYWEGRRRNVN